MMARNAPLLLDMLAATAMVEATRATMHGQPNAASFGGKRMTYMRKESKEAAASGGALDHIAKSEESEQSAAAATAAKTRIACNIGDGIRKISLRFICSLKVAMMRCCSASGEEGGVEREVACGGARKRL